MSAYARSCTTRMSCCLRERDHAFEEFELHALRGRVATGSRAPSSSASGSTPRIARSHSAKKSTLGRHAHGADVGAGDHRAVDVDRVARIRHQHGVAAIERGQHQVREAFLGADRDDGFACRDRSRRRSASCTSCRSRGAAAGCPWTPSSRACRAACAASTSLSTMCCGVGPSGLPMLMSMMSSPRRRAAIFSSAVMLKTYGGRRLMRENSFMRTPGCGAERRVSAGARQRPIIIHTPSESRRHIASLRPAPPLS